MLYLYRRVVFGDLVKDDVKAMTDLTPRELLMLVPIALGVLWMGVYPESFLAPMRGNVASIVARTERARPEGDANLAMGKAKPAPTHGEHAPEATHGETH